MFFGLFTKTSTFRKTATKTSIIRVFAPNNGTIRKFATKSNTIRKLAVKPSTSRHRANLRYKHWNVLVFAAIKRIVLVFNANQWGVLVFTANAEILVFVAILIVLVFVRRVDTRLIIANKTVVLENFFFIYSTINIKLIDYLC